MAASRPSLTSASTLCAPFLPNVSLTHAREKVINSLTEMRLTVGFQTSALDSFRTTRHKAAARAGGVMDFISILSIFVLACFVGYYVVWSVTPSLHTPLMSVTNAISSVIVVGALIASAAAESVGSKWLGLVAVALASVNIFGGFAVTQRMLSMYRKKERKDA
jgi:NAD(P) transhydrogenase subunit alpha